MTDLDKQFEAALRQGYRENEAGRVPDFDNAWTRAEAKVGQKRRRIRALGGLAAAMALVAVVIIGQPRPGDTGWQYIDPNEIAGSTSWIAPSDVLLPTHQIDIYRDIPVLIESTGKDGGTLL